MKRRQHTAEYRAKILDSAKFNGVSKAARAYRINPSVIYRWRKEEKMRNSVLVPANPKPEPYGQTFRDSLKTAIAEKNAEYIHDLQAEIGRLHMLLCRKV